MGKSVSSVGALAFAATGRTVSSSTTAQAVAMEWTLVTKSPCETLASSKIPPDDQTGPVPCGRA